MTDRTLLNARKPAMDEYGYAVLERMNKSHYELTQWGLDHVDKDKAETILDVGCGGGMTVKRLADSTNAIVFGVDVSEASVAKTVELNAENVATGRVKAVVGSAESLPFEKETFDLVTAFETTYYWNDLTQCFSGVREILRPGGVFLVCNEDRDRSRPVVAENADALGMKLYTAEQLGEMLRDAGFAEVHEYTHENGNWVCAVGRK